MNFISIGTPLIDTSEDAPLIHQLEKQIADEKQRISSDRASSVIERIHQRGRFTAEERVQTLCDDHHPWFLGEFQGMDEHVEGNHRPYRLGVLCAIGTVKNRQVMIIANDNTITAGAWWPGTPQKIVHALETALRLQIPVIYLIECAGLYLPHQDKTFASRDGAGAIFETQARLNRSGIRQIAAIFGDCIAGGGYMPLLCDKIVMTEQASLCIGGHAITSHTKGSSSEPLGTPATHVHMSGCAESRVPDEQAALEKLRTWIDQLPSPSTDFFRIDDAIDSPFEQNDLYHLLPIDPSKPFSIEEILARLVDGAQLQRLDDDFGPEILAALALVDGLPTYIIANRGNTTQTQNGLLCAGGILYLDGITKMRKICENAHSNGVPVIWLQDVAGFDVGPDAEKNGLLRHGAMLLRELTCDGLQTPPHLTIILRKASGAGYYAMKGAPFHPALTLAVATSHIEVMSPETLAGTLFDKKIASASDDSKKAALETAKTQTIEAQIQASSPKAAAIRGDIDDIIPLDELRARIVTFLRAAWQNGSRPVKPYRLWG